MLYEVITGDLLYRIKTKRLSTSPHSTYNFDFQFFDHAFIEAYPNVILQNDEQRFSIPPSAQPPTTPGSY